MNARGNELFADRPLQNPRDDRLGYAPFARHLANSLRVMTGAEGLVIALYGAWGSGKSTLLNFVEYYLGQEPEEECPIVVKFEPWWFSGHEDLALRFFEQLLGTISSRQVLTDELRDKLADFGSLVARVPIPHAWAGEVVAKLLRPEGKDIHGLKEEIDEKLKQERTPILVIIDGSSPKCSVVSSKKSPPSSLLERHLLALVPFAATFL